MAYFFPIALERETEDDSGLAGVVAISLNTPASVSSVVARVVIVVLFSLMFVLLNWPPGRDFTPPRACQTVLLYIPCFDLCFGFRPHLGRAIS